MEDIKKNDAAAILPPERKGGPQGQVREGLPRILLCSGGRGQRGVGVRLLFKRPSVPSYDRYLKGVQQSGMTRASKTFLLDCAVDETETA